MPTIHFGKLLFYMQFLTLTGQERIILNGPVTKLRNYENALHTDYSSTMDSANNLLYNEHMQNFQKSLSSLTNNIEKVIVGKRQAIHLAIISLLCRGHLLMEDVPGLGKTMMARSLAHSLALRFKRIQFTPDLLPSDITGVSIFNQKISLPTSSLQTR